MGPDCGFARKAIEGVESCRLDYEPVIISRHRWTAELPNPFNTAVGFRPVSHNVSEADISINLKLFDSRYDGFQGLIVAVNIAEHTVDHERAPPHVVE